MNKGLFKKLLSETRLVIEKYGNDKDYLVRYFEIGKLIVANQDDFESKEKLLNELSKELGGGYGKANLSDMRRLYELYKDLPEQFQSAKKIGWSQIRTLLTIKDNDVRSYLQNRILSENWSNSRLKTELKNRQKTIRNKEKGIDYSDFELNIEKIEIVNFKSIVNIKIEKPNNFTVLVGTNGSGKSNVFEALEMLFNAARVEQNEIFTNFGKKEKIINYKALEKRKDNLEIRIESDDNNSFCVTHKNNQLSKKWTEDKIFNNQFLSVFTRVFVDNSRIIVNKLPIYDKLTQNAGNLIEILNTKIIPDENLFNNFKENLKSLRSNIEEISVIVNNENKKLELQIKEKGFDKAFNETQISDGTMKIIALLAVLFQTNEPQFICIEEPENGLHPYLIRQFVGLCRNLCQLKGDYIWFTTHSPTLVNELKVEELIVTNFKNGYTELIQAKEVVSEEDIKMDDAWLTNHLKGGLPW